MEGFVGIFIRRAFLSFLVLIDSFYFVEELLSHFLQVVYRLLVCTWASLEPVTIVRCCKTYELSFCAVVVPVYDFLCRSIRVDVCANVIKVKGEALVAVSYLSYPVCYPVERGEALFLTEGFKIVIASLVEVFF